MKWLQIVIAKASQGYKKYLSPQIEASFKAIYYLTRRDALRQKNSLDGAGWWIDMRGMKYLSIIEASVWIAPGLDRVAHSDKQTCADFCFWGLAICLWLSIFKKWFLKSIALCNGGWILRRTIWRAWRMLKTHWLLKIFFVMFEKIGISQLYRNHNRKISPIL